jgi:hypothetical protein
MRGMENGWPDRIAVRRPSRVERRRPVDVQGHHPGRSARVRCRCVACGAHVHAVAGERLYGQCSNCGGTDLVGLDPLVSH